MILALFSVLLGAQVIHSVVLDPALYLGPSPPLTLTGDSQSPAEIWEQHFEDKNKIQEDTTEKEQTTLKTIDKESSRMFWPRYDQQPAVGLQIPMSFSLSGTYGKFAGVPSTVIGNTYASISSSGLPGFATGTVFGSYGRAGLAGSSYGGYGQSVRVFGGDNTPSWSGWGNGKWGHYGKG